MAFGKGGSIPHSQELSNNPYPESNQPTSSHWWLISLRSILKWSSHLRLDFVLTSSPVKLTSKWRKVNTCTLSKKKATLNDNSLPLVKFLCLSKFIYTYFHYRQNEMWREHLPESNLGINWGITRMWISLRWVNFAKRPISSRIKLFNQPEISGSGSTA